MSRTHSLETFAPEIQLFDITLIQDQPCEIEILKMMSGNDAILVTREYRHGRKHL